MDRYVALTIRRSTQIQSWFSDNQNLFLLATAYRIVIAVAGCYLTARLAPDRPMAHALAVGAIGVLLSTVGAAVTWNAGPEFGPKWYPIALIVTSLPCAWLGGRLRTWQLHPDANV